MKILLDTHTVLWIVNGDPRLSSRALTAYREADEIYWSIITLWELTLKLSSGKADFILNPDWMQQIQRSMNKNGARCIGIESGHCEILSTLPMVHRDPFDRMMVCQAIHRDLTFVTADSKIAGYPVKTLW